MASSSQTSPVSAPENPTLCLPDPSSGDVTPCSAILDRLSTSPVTPRISHAPSTPLAAAGISSSGDLAAVAKEDSCPAASPAAASLCPGRPLDHTALNAVEAATLQCMLACAERHRVVRDTLVVNTISVGNSAYLGARHVLVEWMFDVSESFRFLPTTLHAAVRHVDVFMSRRRCGQAAWQLCAIASLFIAVKCEESVTQIPLLSQLHQMCGDAYDIDLLRRMEICVLEVLQWDPLDHGAMHFLAFFLRAMDRSRQEVEISVPSFSASNYGSPHSIPPPSLGTKRARSDTNFGSDFIVMELEACRPAKSMRLVPSANADVVREDVARESCLLGFHLDDLASQDILQLSREGEDIEETESVLEDDIGTEFLCAEVQELAHMSNAVLDLALYDPSIGAAFNPRLLAAAALYTSRRSSSEPSTWSPFFVSITGVSELELLPCADVLSHVFASAQYSDVTCLDEKHVDVVSSPVS
jgi:Cyclin, N-terminal domain/Cyclin, C-terminal domain